MPKQFRNNKKILAATVLTTALAIAPVVSNAEEPAVNGEGPIISMPTVDQNGNTGYEQGDLNPGENQPAEPGEGLGSSTPSVDKNGNTLDPDAGQPAEKGEGPIISMPTVDEFGNTVYEQGDLNPDAGQPAEKGEGPVVSMPMVDEKGNTIYAKYNTNASKPATNIVSKNSTTENLNPKTGDSSMIGYVGLGLSSVLGLFRKRK